MTLYCPRCGTREVDERVKQVAYVVNHYYYHRRPDQSAATVEDYGEVMEVVEYECRGCGYAAPGDEDWSSTPEELQRDQWLDWGDVQHDEEVLR